MFKNLASAESAVNGKRQLEVLFGRLREQMVVMVASQKDRGLGFVWDQLFRDDVEGFT
jgi:hypothetical protein